MNPTAVFSKSGKGVQEASGKTSHLSRADRAVLSAFDGRITVADVAEKVGKPFDPKFEQLIEQLEKDGFVRQVSAGAAPPQPGQPPSRPGAGKAPPPAALGEELDFTIFSAPKPAAAKPSASPVDLAAKAREESERKAKEEHATSYKARQEIERARLEAEARAKAAAQARVQAEAAAKAKSESEAKAKADAEASARAKAAEAEAKVRAEADAKVKAARDAAVRLAAEAKAKAEADLQSKLEAERAKGREEAERIRREAEEKSRREAEELRKTLEEERKAREEAEAARRKAEEQARAEAERARKEAEEKARKEAEEKARKEAEELRQRLEEERKAREEAEAARKKAEEQAREEERRRREEDERRAREEAERKQREEQERAERKAREEQERAEREKQERAEREKQERVEREARERAEKEKAEREKQERKEREREEKERAQREEKERKERERAEREEREREEGERKEREKREKVEREKVEQKAAAAPAAPGNFSDSLLADLDSFGQREDEERKAREEADAAKKKAEQQARAEAERRAREEEERREKEEAERRKRQEAERKAKEEAERKAEEEAREAAARAADERKREARESLAAKAAPADDDIGVTDEDLDMDEVKRDQKALSQEARRAAREREREQEKAKSRPREDAEEQEAAPVAAAAPQRVRRPMKWGKPVALVLFVLLVAGIGAVHVMPISTGAYEKAAAEALGVPVKIGSARVSLFTGVQLKLDNISAGPARIATARAFPALGSLLGERKTFSRIELDGVSLPQEAVGAVLAGKARSANFEVQRVVAQKVKLEGPLVLPLLDADLAFGAEGSVASGTVRGPEGLAGKLAPRGADVEFELHAGSFVLPVAPEVTLNQLDMKGVAGRTGMEISAWSATLFDGVMSGTAKLAWGSSTSLDGVVTVRGMNVGVFAPGLVSEGKVEGTGRFSMSGADAGKLGAAARLEGNFTITKGVIGSFDLSRALTTGGRQSSGRTPFAEMVGQGVYDKGAVQLRNVTIGAGALNAGASVDIAPGGALSGRIVADVRAATQTIRATLNLGGTVREPQVRN